MSEPLFHYSKKNECECFGAEMAGALPAARASRLRPRSRCGGAPNTIFRFNNLETR
ncbi:hypothetical protein BSIN_2524 [Burkholderia singularis]|uniref:Uncharacterized protein n=2 Tax=Burkholderia singularis TaxID=1503053 RepID=A0A238H2M7_9BURK|nr:hypothetical protein BSIN_2524 [Burkholderia singularis]